MIIITAGHVVFFSFPPRTFRDSVVVFIRLLRSARVQSATRQRRIEDRAEDGAR